MPNIETRWWWVRHAPVPDGGCIYGQSDLDCDCGDVAVFNALAKELPHGAVWITSNLARTRQTAAAIKAAAEGRYDGPDPTPVAAFAEQHLGAWQGMNRAEFLAGRADQRHPFCFGLASERPPGGETFAELADRVAGAITQLTETHRGRDIVAVTHGGTIRAALAMALGIAPEAALAFVIENCSITRLDQLDVDGRSYWRVTAVNHRPWGPGAQVSNHPAAHDQRSGTNR
jgi:broad specificity phosphatase PhoE